MKKITCIQQYVIDRLIDDEKMSIGNLINAMSKVCSEEQFNNILSILIETPIHCESSQGSTNLVRMSMCVSKEAGDKNKMQIMKILKEQFSLGIKQTKEYVDSCIGKYNILPKAVTQAEIDEVIEKLEPYNVIISTAGFY